MKRKPPIPEGLICGLLLLAFMLTCCLYACKNDPDKDKIRTTDSGAGTETQKEDSGKEQETEKPPVTQETEPAVIRTDTVNIAPGGTMYDSTVIMKLTAAEPSTIYYTLDGTLPDKSSEKYTKGVSLTGNGRICYAVRARALYEDGTWSECAYHTYFINKNIEGLFDVPVFSVITDPDGL